MLESLNAAYQYIRKRLQFPNVNNRKSSISNIVPDKNKLIKVIGVGGGGISSVQYMLKKGMKDVEFAICDTDAIVLDKLEIPTKFYLGPKLAKGLGTGYNPEIGRQACLESIKEVEKYLRDKSKMVFIITTMGGGTGTGAAPIIAMKAKELNILTVGICTLPFKFEGLRRTRNALEGIEELKNQVDAILIFPNERQNDFFEEDITISNAFNNMDEIMSTPVKAVTEVIAYSGILNINFKDIETTLRNSGVIYVANALCAGENRATKAIEETLNFPLLKNSDIRGSENIILSISTSFESELMKSELNEITNYIIEEAGFGTSIIVGHCHNETLKEKIRIILIATGLRDDAYISKGHVIIKPSETDLANEINVPENYELIDDDIPISESSIVRQGDNCEFIINSLFKNPITNSKEIEILDNGERKSIDVLITEMPIFIEKPIGKLDSDNKV